MKTNAPQTIDDYIAGYPKDIQAILKKIRTTIRKAAPRAEEVMSYQMPTFRLKGNLVYFAAFKNHIGFYPTPTGTEKFQRELAIYKGGKGSISKIVKFRVKENLARAAAKGKKK